MVTSAFINLWDRRVGAVAWNAQSGLAAFEFDPAFLENQLDVAPIMMPAANARNRIFTFPETRNNNTFKGLPGLLADMLPDKYGNALINAWLASQGRPPDSMNPVEMLCFIGKRAVGAMEIEPALQPTFDKLAKIEIDSLVELADDILNQRKSFQTKLNDDQAKALTEIIKIGTSAGGARAKALIAFSPETLEVRSGQTMAPKGFSYWLLKFDGIADSESRITKGYGRAEMAYYLMAEDAGILMTECRLLEENDRAHFMTKRFDRTDDGQRIHLQSFCALRHFDYNMVGYYSYEQLFETMRMLERPYPEAEQLFRRMVFNVLARNCDDHTKNFSFLMDRSGNWKLSPAYDICYSYRPDSHWVSRQSLSINGKRQEFSVEDFLAVARQMNIRKAPAIIIDILGIVADWEHYAARTNVDEPMKKHIGENLITRL
jgi:serine/threonine-protein kinase HipA